MRGFEPLAQAIPRAVATLLRDTPMSPGKLAFAWKTVVGPAMYGEGISKTGDLLDLAVDKRIVEKSGAWFAYAGERLGQGRENAKQFLKENPDICKTIEDRVRKELGLTTRNDEN